MTAVKWIREPCSFFFIRSLYEVCTITWYKILTLSKNWPESVKLYISLYKAKNVILPMCSSWRLIVYECSYVLCSCTCVYVCKCLGVCVCVCVSCCQSFRICIEMCPTNARKPTTALYQWSGKRKNQKSQKPENPDLWYYSRPVWIVSLFLA